MHATPDFLLFSKSLWQETSRFLFFRIVAPIKDDRHLIPFSSGKFSPRQYPRDYLRHQLHQPLISMQILRHKFFKKEMKKKNRLAYIFLYLTGYRSGWQMKDVIERHPHRRPTHPVKNYTAPRIIGNYYLPILMPLPLSSFNGITVNHSERNRSRFIRGQ